MNEISWEDTDNIQIFDRIIVTITYKVSFEHAIKHLQH